MKKIFCLISVVLFSSCSSDNKPITLVCNGIQTIDSKNLVTNKFYPTEKNKVSRTYRLTYEERDVEKLDKSEKKKVWVFNSESQPEIYEENKKTSINLKDSTVDVKTFRFVFVRKDDISVSSNYSKNENNKSTQQTDFILYVDRVTGNFTETEIYSSQKELTKESIEGTCVKVEKNKI